MVMCSAHTHRWPDLTKYKLLIIQTAHLPPGWLGWSATLPFERMPAATGTSDWSPMNLDLYNFHLRTSPIVTLQPSPAPSSTMVSASWGSRRASCPFQPSRNARSRYLDLPSAEGHSVNDDIPKTPFSVQYVTVDAFVAGIMARGRGTLSDNVI